MWQIASRLQGVSRWLGQGGIAFPGIVLGLWLVTAAVQANSQDAVTENVANYAAIGSAYNLRGEGELLYREYYSPLSPQRQVQVEYRRPDGEAIARKTLTYGEVLYQPGFVYEDLRDNQTLGAVWRDSQLVLLRSGRNALREKPIKPMSPVVVDAGFDHFIQSRWDALSSGERVRFNFAFPNRLTSVLLVAEQVPSADSPLHRPEQSWRYFRIEVANRLMAMFADTIWLAYDPATRQLMVYQGRSNLDSDSGGTWDVRIEYQYPE